jgi:opacity protein-like surface antigen
MKNVKFTVTRLVIALLVVLAGLAMAADAQDPQTQSQATAIMRGYRTGYSDGYQAGLVDLANQNPRDFRSKAEYDRADRAYHSSYGTFDDFRDGFQQGYEAGYNAAYDRKPFDSSFPPDLKRRSGDETVTNTPPSEPTQPADSQQPANPTQQSGGGVLIPRDTILQIELLNNLSSDASKKGDRFQGRVIDPKEYDGATVEGQVANVKRPGKAKGTAELQLSFDLIRLADGRSAKLNAQVIEVIAGGSDVGKVDSEGGVQGKDTTRQDVKKVGILSGIGAAIGAIAGGGAGAAVGATIGAGTGTAGVLTQRGRDIRLSQGQHLRIRTNSDAEIQ